MIDCGEGTQFRFMQYGLKPGKLDHIFISHLHGDHFFGLVGLITTMNLNWREYPLHIYGPAALKEIIDVHFKYANTQLKFELIFHAVEANESQIIFDDNNLTVETIILKHRLPTTGFIFREKNSLRKILPEKIAEYNIPYEKINGIKAGNDFVNSDGKIIPNSLLTDDPSKPRSYAYCSDTIYHEDIATNIRGVDLLYHEATFIHEHEERATETFHTTTKQAAAIAKLSEAGRLIIGHFSARYDNLESLVNESREVFPNSDLAIEGKIFTI
jgi:ribonuclease Z